MLGAGCGAQTPARALGGFEGWAATAARPDHAHLHPHEGARPGAELVPDSRTPTSTPSSGAWKVGMEGSAGCSLAGGAMPTT